MSRIRPRTLFFAYAGAVSLAATLAPAGVRPTILILAVLVATNLVAERLQRRLPPSGSGGLRPL